VVVDDIQRVRAESPPRATIPISSVSAQAQKARSFAATNANDKIVREAAHNNPKLVIDVNTVLDPKLLLTTAKTLVEKFKNAPIEQQEIAASAFLFDNGEDMLRKLANNTPHVPLVSYFQNIENGVIVPNVVTLSGAIIASLVSNSVSKAYSLNFRWAYISINLAFSVRHSASHSDSTR
jgi:hypothetical protein